MHVVRDLREGLAFLHHPQLRFDVVFVSHHFGDDPVAQFIDQAKKTPMGSACAYIVIFRGDQSEGASLASNLCKGANSFLIAPFSVASVAETAAIAFAVRRRNADERLAAASGMILDSMLQEIDKRAAQKSAGKKPAAIRKTLQDAAQQFKAVSGASIQTFHSAALDKFSAIAASENGAESEADAAKRGYDGPSERVKKLYAEEHDGVSSSSAPSVAGSKAK